MTQPLPVVILARDFFTLQEERVRQYATLSASHREYLNSAPSYDILTYQKAVADATKNFKEISERIIEMRRQLDEEFREKVLECVCLVVVDLGWVDLYSGVPILLGQMEIWHNWLGVGQDGGTSTQPRSTTTRFTLYSEIEFKFVSSKELSNFIAKIQLLEEQNLRLTVDHQLASQQALDDPDDELLERNAKGIKKKLTEIAQEIR